MARQVSSSSSSSRRREPAPERSKSGCFTCRIRRKKCDGSATDDACPQCVRLKIECLGYGLRRPDWCRDKAQMEKYKAELKKKLATRAGVRANATRTRNLLAQQEAYALVSPEVSPEMRQLSMSPIPFASTSTITNNQHQHQHHQQNPVPSFSVSQSMFGAARLESIKNLAVSLDLPAAYLAAVTRVQELADWKERASQFGVLSRLELAERGRAIEHKLSEQLAGPGAAFAWEELIGLGLENPVAPMSDIASLGWSDSPSLDVTPELVQAELYAQLANFGSNHMSHYASPLTPLNQLVDGSHLHPVNDPIMYTPAHSSSLLLSPACLGVQPELTPVKTQEQDVLTTACQLLIHSVVSEPSVHVPEISNCLATIGRVFQPDMIASQGIQAIFAASVGACFAETDLQLRYFQSAIGVLAGQASPLERLCLEVIQTARI